MNIIIIEDETITAEDLQYSILQVQPKANIVKVLSSVKEAVHYFKTNSMPDLIFSDIQLGDGLSFEIFQRVEVNVPIIFCTAYDEYALKAFDTNGIHYILKPFDEAKIEEALEKFKSFKSIFSFENASILEVIKTLQQKPQEQVGSILVYQQDKVIPIKLNEIALFFIRNEVTHLFTFKQKTFYINKSLDEVQQICGPDFYRVNRQFILHRNAIKEISKTMARRVSIDLNVPFPEGITVSKEKMTDFLDWLKNS